MSTNQQRREAAKRKLERQQERRSQRAQRRKRTATIVAIGVVVAVVGATVAFATTSGSSQPPDPAAAPTDAEVIAGACRYVKDEEPARPVGLPTNTDPPKQGTVDVTITTNQGVLPVTLDRAKAPCTVESFVSLAKAKYYDDTPCHRLVTGGSLQVLQCGDPTGTGTGGPGYTIPDEKPLGLQSTAGGQASLYPRGVVAMAKTAQPNSGGSQFFLVYADSQLPPDYTIFGTVAEPGIKVLEKVAAAGDDGSMAAGGGKPKLATQIQSVAVAAP